MGIVKLQQLEEPIKLTIRGRLEDVVKYRQLFSGAVSANLDGVYQSSCRGKEFKDLCKDWGTSALFILQNVV